MLKTGLLWFDDDPRRPFSVKIERAAAYYTAKYGRAPNVCYVHPSCLPQPAPEPACVAVHSAPDILPHHFMLGVAPTGE